MSQLQTREQKTTSVATLLQSEGMLRQLKMAIPRGGASAERMVRIVLTECRRTPKLLECSRESLLGALMHCAQLGLEPGPMGKAWIIPYKGEAQLQLGYKGLLDLAWRSEQISSVQADVVYRPDHFVFRKGTDPKLEHIPTEDPERLGTDRTHAWACVHTRSGGVVFDAMSIAQVEAIRKRSKSPNSPAWVNDWDEMAKKTVLRRVLKLAPCSSETQRAIALDEMADVGIAQQLDVDAPDVAEPVDAEVVDEAEKDDRKSAPNGNEPEQGELR